MNSFIAAFISSLIGFINVLLTNYSLVVSQNITEVLIDGKEEVIFELRIKEKENEPVNENIEEENVDEVIAEEVKEEVMKSQTESERTEKLRDKINKIVKYVIDKMNAEQQNEQISEQSAETEVKTEEKKEEKKEEKVEVKTEEKKEEVDDDEIEETFGDYQDEIINFRIDFEGDIDFQITYFMDLCDAAQSLNKNENINLSIEEFCDILYCIVKFYKYNPSFYRHLLMKFVGRISNIYRHSRKNWSINLDTVDFGVILKDCCPEDEDYLDSYINACKWFLNKTSGIKCWKKESRQKFGSWLREIDNQ